MMTETELSKQIKKFLDKCGVFNFRIQSGRVQKGNHWIYLAEPGTPDRCALIKGQSVFIEVKSAGQKPTSDQINAHKRIRQSAEL